MRNTLSTYSHYGIKGFTKTNEGDNMYTMSLAIGPCQVQLETDERLSFDAVESLLNRGTLTVLTLMNAHIDAVAQAQMEEDNQVNNIIGFPKNTE